MGRIGAQVLERVADVSGAVHDHDFGFLPGYAGPHQLFAIAGEARLAVEAEMIAHTRDLERAQRVQVDFSRLLVRVRQFRNLRARIEQGRIFFQLIGRTGVNDEIFFRVIARMHRAAVLERDPPFKAIVEIFFVNLRLLVRDAPTAHEEQLVSIG